MWDGEIREAPYVQGTPERGDMKLYLVLDYFVVEAGERGTQQHWPIRHSAKLWEETGVVKMSSTFCSSQLNQYVPCGSCWWIMITGCLREISHFLSGKRQNGKLPTRSSPAGAKTPASGTTGRSHMCFLSLCNSREGWEPIDTQSIWRMCAGTYKQSQGSRPWPAPCKVYERHITAVSSEGQ